MTDSRVDMIEDFLDKFGLNYMAIQGSTDDVDIIDRDIERLKPKPNLPWLSC